MNELSSENLRGGRLEATEIAHTLRATPFHQWSLIRDKTDLKDLCAFETASSVVRREWNKLDLHTQLRHALTAAATHVVLAMKEVGDPGEPDCDLDARLQDALRTLTAATTLSAA